MRFLLAVTSAWVLECDASGSERIPIERYGGKWPLRPEDDDDIPVQEIPLSRHAVKWALGQVDEARLGLDDDLEVQPIPIERRAGKWPLTQRRVRDPDLLSRRRLPPMLPAVVGARRDVWALGFREKVGSCQAAVEHAACNWPTTMEWVEYPTNSGLFKSAVLGDVGDHGEGVFAVVPSGAPGTISDMLMAMCYHKAVLEVLGGLEGHAAKPVSSEAITPACEPAVLVEGGGLFTRGLELTSLTAPISESNLAALGMATVRILASLHRRGFAHTRITTSSFYMSMAMGRVMIRDLDKAVVAGDNALKTEDLKALARMLAGLWGMSASSDAALIEALTVDDRNPGLAAPLIEMLTADGLNYDRWYTAFMYTGGSEIPELEFAEDMYAPIFNH